ncbi:sensor histidine kinase [Flexithrix dorotheae]|uniref:sensor histidine kinase n=1 Tax=Flexithrix dorotheae TaxID=70993 RepID=UPI00037F88FA|nr:HAMP domain-containing sensor histidine kinase [Flexithrix dorotheae]
MNLLLKTTLYYLIIALAVFGIGIWITFSVIKKDVDLETDRYLWEKHKDITQAISRGVAVTDINNEKINISLLEGNNLQAVKPYFSDTIVQHRILKREEPHRKLNAIEKINDQFYQITLYDVILETDDIYESSVYSLSMIFLLLALVLVMSSFLISQKLLKPFEMTLDIIKKFKLQNKEPLNLPETNIKEFNDLNNFITEMTRKISQDYINLKEFSENASHEMQTPLAIAKGKMELLLESPNLNDEQLQLIGSTHQAISKLSKLGQSLSILTKIENKEYSNLQKINLTRIIENMIFNFKELIELKGIRLENELEENVFINMDPYLLDMLLTNLLQNAIRHNFENGKIKIDLTSSKLEISNTGKPLKVDPEKLFERFRKDNQSQESIGLGLSIVSKICDVNQIKVIYSYSEEMHSVILKLKKIKWTSTSEFLQN